VGLALRQDARHQQALRERDGRHAVSLERAFLERELRGLRADLSYLAQQPLLARFVAGDTGARRELEREYAGFARSKPAYDQVRLLDATGHEVVRVHRRGTEVQVVDTADLQSKAARYYFREAMALAPGRVFVSPLDLNVERGGIERPLRPVIRLATPVADAGGTTRAVLVLNYAGARLLARLREIAAGSRAQGMLVDEHGQYLQAPDASREWGRLLGHGASFADDHPRAWQAIRGAERSQVEIGGDLFTAERVAFAEGLPGGVRIVSHIPAAEGAGGAGTRRALAGAGAFAAIAALSFYWARASERRRTQDRRIAASEARLRTLSSRLLAAQEEERRSLSRLLHDELGQQVTAIALDLKNGLRRQGDDAAPALRRAAAETENVLASLREIATRVRPSVLDDLGLADAIESHVSEFQERSGIPVQLELRLRGEEPSGPVAENLYRIVQEALANVAQHARAATARVCLTRDADGLTLLVEDDGCGFDPATLPGTRRLGVLGMRERVELLGGGFEIETAPGAGTKVRVRLPASAVAPQGSEA
ncbi:MAG: ATP-binding protein, partial [Myxococcota bacterium]